MRALITGGLGFIGSHLAEALLARGDQVAILDNFSRPGFAVHLDALIKAGLGTPPTRQDIRDSGAVVEAVSQADVVFHLAAQVAVTRSVADPRTDFEVNTLGTLNVLEAVRVRPEPRPPVLYASTSKVYGYLRADWDADARRWRARRTPWANADGSVEEHQSLEFRSPFGCSKGAADQYVLDYARTYGLRTAVLRTSCVYGPRQFGCADQGWLAWFAVAAALGRPITVYGDGYQVRDVLHVRDCVEAYLLAADYLLKARFGMWLRLNIGGGPGNILSILAGIRLIQQAAGRKIPVTFGPWRVGDQRAYVSNIGRAKKLLGWSPIVQAENGVVELVTWILENKATVEEVFRDE